MKEQLLKAMQRNQIVNMMYISKSGGVTKRYIKIVGIRFKSFILQDRLSVPLLSTCSCCISNINKRA